MSKRQHWMTSIQITLIKSLHGSKCQWDNHWYWHSYSLCWLTLSLFAMSFVKS